MLSASCGCNITWLKNNMASTFTPSNVSSLKLKSHRLKLGRDPSFSSVRVSCCYNKHNSSKNNVDIVKKLVHTIGVTSVSSSPHKSLHEGNWVKLICGASFEDVADVRNLSLVYTLAGVDCIDCAAEVSVVNAVNQGIQAARDIVSLRRPWVMISVNDDEDLHFRKAGFDPEDCPIDCTRPCERVCPADAISLNVYEADVQQKFQGGVITERCYGCGRCFPVCPYDKISPITYVRDATATSELLRREDVDALEIHTSGRQIHMFKELWKKLEDSIRHVKLIAVSLPDLGDSTLPLMNMMYSTMKPHLQLYNLWQLDGRPMSGDIGRGATKESIKFASRLAALDDRPRGFLQLAGGTNFHTVDGLQKAGLFQTTSSCDMYRYENFEAKSLRSPPAVIGGVAYGGYARKMVGKVLHKMQLQNDQTYIEEHPEFLLEALREALGLVGTVKRYNLSCQLI